MGNTPSGLSQKEMEKLEADIEATQDNIKKAISILRREQIAMRSQEQKAKREIRNYAEKNQPQLCKMMAKEYVRTHKTYLRFAKQEATMKSLLLQVKSMVSQMKISQAMGSTTMILENANELMSNPTTAKIFQTFTQNAAKLNMKMELQEQFVDNAFQDEDEEVETENILNQVLTDIAYSNTAGLNVPTGRVISTVKQNAPINNALIPNQKPLGPIVIGDDDEIELIKKKTASLLPDNLVPKPINLPPPPSINNGVLPPKKQNPIIPEKIDLDTMFGPMTNFPMPTKAPEISKNLSKVESTPKPVISKIYEPSWESYICMDKKYDEVNSFYVNQLTEKQSMIYTFMKNGLANLQDEICFPEEMVVSQTDYIRVLSLARVELPQFYWLCDFSTYVRNERDIIIKQKVLYERGYVAISTYNEMYPTKNIPKNKDGIKILALKIDKFTHDVIKNVMEPLSDTSKEQVKKFCFHFLHGTNAKIARSKDCMMFLALNNYICNYADYSHEKGGDPEVLKQKYTMFGFLFKKSGVCQSYIHVMKYILTRAMIKSVFVGGRTINTDTSENHCWLSTQIKGSDGELVWGVTDTTWCDRGLSSKEIINIETGAPVLLSNMGTKVLPDDGELSVSISNAQDHSSSFFMVPDSFAYKSRILDSKEEFNFEIPKAPDTCLAYNPLVEMGLFFNYKANETEATLNTKKKVLTNGMFKSLNDNCIYITSTRPHLIDILFPQSYDIKNRPDDKEKAHNIMESCAYQAMNKILNIRRIPLTIRMVQETSLAYTLYITPNKDFGDIKEYVFMNEEETKQAFDSRNENGEYDSTNIKKLIAKMLAEGKNKFFVCVSHIYDLPKMKEFTKYITNNCLKSDWMASSKYNSASFVTNSVSGVLKVEYK